MLGRAVLGMYPAWAQKNDNFEIYSDAIEETGAVPLIDDVLFAYRADAIVTRKRKGGQPSFWLHDFKTVSGSLPEDPSWLDFDEQITNYLAAVEAVYNVKFTGAIFTFVLAEVPPTPEVLKSTGGLSKNVRQRTPAEAYFNKLKELGEDPREYTDILKVLAAKNKWFARFEILRTRDQLRTTWLNNQAIAREMIRPDVLIYPAPSKMNCNKCAYQGPCLIEGSGKDPAQVLETEYALGDTNR
jgi:hypothetical protein